MVELTDDVAEQIRTHYGDETVEEYRSLMPREVIDRAEGSYQRVEDHQQQMHPDNVASLPAEYGLAGALEELDRLAQEWRNDALTYMMSIPVREAQDEALDEFEL